MSLCLLRSQYRSIYYRFARLRSKYLLQCIYCHDKKLSIFWRHTFVYGRWELHIECSLYSALSKQVITSYLRISLHMFMFYLHMHVCAHAYMCTCIYQGTRACSHALVYAWAHIYTCIYMNIASISMHYTQIYTYLETHKIHSNNYTYINAHKRACNFT